jgi:hypothetical protein
MPVLSVVTEPGFEAWVFLLPRQQKKISCFLTAMGENTIKYGRVRPRSYFLLVWATMSENTTKYSIIHIHI